MQSWCFGQILTSVLQIFKVSLYPHPQKMQSWRFWIDLDFITSDFKVPFYLPHSAPSTPQCKVQFFNGSLLQHFRFHLRSATLHPRGDLKVCHLLSSSQSGSCSHYCLVFPPWSISNNMSCSHHCPCSQGTSCSQNSLINTKHAKDDVCYFELFALEGSGGC